MPSVPGSIKSARPDLAPLVRALKAGIAIFFSETVNLHVRGYRLTTRGYLLRLR